MYYTSIAKALFCCFGTLRTTFIVEYCVPLLHWNIALTCFVGFEHYGISDYFITLQLQKSCFVGILSTGHHLITSIVWENSREEWSPTNRWVNALNCVVVQLVVQFGNAFRQPSFNRWVNAHNCVVVQLVIQSVVQFGNTLGQPSFNRLVNAHNCNLCFMFTK